MLIASLALVTLSGVVQPDLAAHLASVAPDAEVRVLVHLEERYPRHELLARAQRLPRNERAAFVREELRSFSARSSLRITRTLDALRDEGAILSSRDLWIVNARAVRCRASAVEELALLEGVARVSWDPVLELEDLADVGPPPAPRSTAHGSTSGGGAFSVATPNVIASQAPHLWRMGVDGSGVLVVHIDSGVAREHPDLAESIWQNPGEIADNGIDDDGNGFVDDLWGWDFADDDNDPWDDGHGTRTAGLIVGDGTTNNGTVTGLAPKASLAVVRVDSQSGMLSAYQYAIQIGADCVSSSYSVKWLSSPDYAAFRAAMEAELAAGIVHANSVGNQGQLRATYPKPWNIAAPANCPSPWIHPDEEPNGLSSMLAVGAILLPDDELYRPSSRGPVAWEDVRLTTPAYPYAQDEDYWDYPFTASDRRGLLKPDLVTYTGVKTTDGSDGHLDALFGTSASAPQVGGALALPHDANERALPRQIARALMESAGDLDNPGKDVRTGAGKLLAFEAALRVLSLVTVYPNEVSLGETFQLEISGPERAPYLLALGTELGLYPTLFGFSLDLADPVPMVAGTFGPVPTTYEIWVPPSPDLAGKTLHFQVIANDSLGLSRRWLRSVVESLTVH